MPIQKCATFRLTKEFKSLLKSSSDYWTVRPKGTDLLLWEGNIHNLDDPRHVGKNYSLEITFNENHPYKPPTVRFIDEVDCQFVNPYNGDLCMDILNDEWTPALMVDHIMHSICSLLTDAPVPNGSYRSDKSAQRVKRRRRNELQMLSV